MSRHGRERWRGWSFGTMRCIRCGKTRNTRNMRNTRNISIDVPRVPFIPRVPRFPSSSKRATPKSKRSKNPFDLFASTFASALLLLGLGLRVVNHDFDAAVHLSSRGGVVGRDRFGFTEASYGFDAF